MPFLRSRSLPGPHGQVIGSVCGRSPTAFSPVASSPAALPWLARIVTAVALGASLSACTPGDPGDPGDPGLDGAPVTVLAAASLSDVFADLDEVTPTLSATFSFGSSTALAEQAAQGAPGDVLATADRVAMDLAVTARAVTAAPVAFATNHLVLVVPADNPAGIRSLADLAGADWVRCANDVPCGRLAVQVLGSGQNATALGTAAPVSLEADVRSVLARVTAGEADAGLVYATDAVEAGDAVQVLELPGAQTLSTRYWVAPLADGDQGAATAWIAALTSASGRHLLDEAGFESP